MLRKRGRNRKSTVILDSSNFDFHFVDTKVHDNFDVVSTYTNLGSLGQKFYTYSMNPLTTQLRIISIILVYL